MKISGIYQIQSIINPERIYIGSAINITNIWDHHKSLLRLNKHHSIKLQNHYNKYGLSDLELIILHECNKELLIIEEQRFINEFNPWFNICKIAGSSIGRICSDETKRKIGIKSLNRIFSEDSKLKMRNKKLGIKLSDQTKNKMKGPRNKKWKLSEETKIKMSISKLNNKNSFGFKHSKETLMKWNNKSSDTINKMKKSQRKRRIRERTSI